MINLPDKLHGWKERKTAPLSYRQCPNCVRTEEEDLLSPDSEGLIKCYICKVSTAPEQWICVHRQGPVAVCGLCGRDVRLTKSMLSLSTGCHYFCPHCSNVVAARYAHKIVDIRDATKPSWNPELLRSAERVGRLRFGICRRQREHLVIRLLQRQAMGEENSLLFGDERKYRAGLCFDKNAYHGYLIWSSTQVPVLHQLFVHPDQRRRGLGTRLVRYWAERFAFPKTEHFGACQRV
jgi:GNAT superfamily N-acetyltransferase